MNHKNISVVGLAISEVANCLSIRCQDYDEFSHKKSTCLGGLFSFCVSFFFLHM